MVPGGRHARRWLPIVWPRCVTRPIDLPFVSKPDPEASLELAEDPRACTQDPDRATSQALLSLYA